MTLVQLNQDLAIEASARNFLDTLLPDQDWEVEHVKHTPQRFAQALKELTTPEDFKFTTFENHDNLNEMVIVQDIAYISLCAHHVLPFFGRAHIAYIPEDRLPGLSKIARTVTYMSRGLWVQEQLTDAICRFLEDHLQPLGLAVVMKGEHMCMSVRGANQPQSKTTTSAMRGVFLDTTKHARQEFFELIK